MSRKTARLDNIDSAIISSSIMHGNIKLKPLIFPLSFVFCKRDEALVYENALKHQVFASLKFDYFRKKIFTLLMSLR